MSYLIEGAKWPKQSSDGAWFAVAFGASVDDKPRSRKKAASWSLLTTREFGSPEEAQHWLAANAERLVREQVVAVRLLQVVAHYAPHCVAFFPEVPRDTVKQMTEREASATLRYDGTPGDEWKQDKGGDE